MLPKGLFFILFNMSELSWLISQHATTLTLAVKLVVIYLVCLAKPQWRIIDNNVYSAAVRNIHIYMHNWALQPFSQDYGPTSHTTPVVCLNFIRKWRDLQFNVDSERQIFWETFSWQVYLLSAFLPDICWKEIAKEIFFFSYFVLMSDLGYESRLYV